MVKRRLAGAKNINGYLFTTFAGTKSGNKRSEGAENSGERGG
jgi:hypothetical protein